MMHRLLLAARALHRGESGQMGLMLLLSFLIVSIFFALALDVGLWAFDHRLAQLQAEAAAAAAIVDLPSTSMSVATTAVNDWLNLNGFDPTKNLCATPVEVRNDVADANNAYDTVRVCVRRESPVLLFSALSKIVAVNVSAVATARVKEVPSLYALMAMNPTRCKSMYAFGNVQVTVSGGGGSYTKSSCSTDALNGQGQQTRFITGLNDVVGGWTEDDSLNLQPNGSAQMPLPDPFGDLTQPVPTGGCQPTPYPDSDTISAGRYCSTFHKTGPGILELQSGIYYFEDDLIITSGTFRTLPGAEVLIYMTCPPPYPCDAIAGRVPGDLEFGGGAVVQLHGIVTTSNPLYPLYPRMLIWVDRTAAKNGDGTPIQQVRIRGNNADIFEGRLYAFHSLVDIGGTPGVELELNMSIVADQISFQGNAEFELPYDPALAPPIKYRAIIE